MIQSATAAPPVAGNDSFTSLEDQLFIIPISALLANDSDADGDVLTISSMFIYATNGNLAFGTNNDVYFTPITNFNGPTTFTYDVTDNHGGNANATVTMVVTSVIDPPINLPPTTLTAVEDTLTSLTGLAVQAVDAGGEKHTLTLNVDRGKLFLTGGPAILTGSGTSNLTVHGTLTQINTSLTNQVKFLAPTNFSGPVTLTMTTTDNGNLDGTVRTDTDQLTLNVTPVNDPPMAVNDYFTINKNQSFIIPRSALLANDADADGDAFAIVSMFIYATNGSLAFGTNDDIYFTPVTNFTGLTEFTYDVADSHFASASATVSILVLNRPTLTPLGLDRGRYQFYLNGEAGTKYQLQTSSNLVHWTEWFTLTPSATNTFLEDTAADTFSKRFYRAMIVP